MIVEVVMPRFSDSMTEGTVTAWFRSEGDTVAEGEPIAEIETEKSTVDLEAPAAGVLARIAVNVGSTAVAVGTLLAEIETEARAGVPVPGADTMPAAAAHDAESERQAASIVAARRIEPARPEAESVPAEANESATAELLAVAGEAIAATPLARRMAAQAGLSLVALSRTGIGGKVCKADVEAALGRTAAAPVAVHAARSGAARAAAPASEPAVTAGSDTLVPLSRVRRTVAERMTRAAATIPHFYLSSECRAGRLLDAREKLKADGLSVSINDLVVRATAIALRQVPEANASWREGEGIVLHERIDIAVAVALEDGLVTPVLRAADELGLSAIASGIRDLAARAREGRLAPAEYDRGTFTISNLGMFGVSEMFAIINPPQACILGVGAVEQKPVVEDGKVVPGSTMMLSLSADHRVLDGATGARLLSAIRRLLEEPLRMLA